LLRDMMHSGRRKGKEWNRKGTETDPGLSSYEKPNHWKFAITNVLLAHHITYWQCLITLLVIWKHRWLWISFLSCYKIFWFPWFFICYYWIYSLSYLILKRLFIVKFIAPTILTIYKCTLQWDPSLKRLRNQDMCKGIFS
jgi:hypothetical protein